jgi:aryl-alcohol dehydrogenase-like predicted oxidoreductase
MKTRKLGWTDLNLSVIGLGTWAIGGPWTWGWGPQDDTESIATISRALEMGVNWIDTAPVYGLGRSEEIVGRAIEGLRDKPIVATKCGPVWDENGNISNRLKE